MGSDYSTSGGTTPHDILNTYAQRMPALTNETAGLIPDVMQQVLMAANEQVNPTNPNELGLNALNLQQLRQYGLPEAEVGQQIARSNALSGAQTNLAQLQGPGGAAASSATALNKELNPAYYTNLNTATDAASRAAGSINLQGLSPGEEAAIERSTNQSNTATGNLGLVNPTNIIGNAMNFGGAYNAKIPMLQGAANTANSIANTAAGGGGVNPVNVALGQPNQSTASNFGSGQFVATTPTSAAGPASNTFGFSQGLYSTLGSSNAAAQSAGASMANATSPAAYLNAA